MIDTPDDWEMTAGEEVGDYFDVEGPTGVTLSFRTIEGTEDAMEEAIEESMAFLKENYQDVELGEAQDSTQRGLKGFYATGKGKDEEGESVVFGMAWYALKDGHIGEIWFVAAEGDKAGATAAGKVLDSFRAP